MTARKNIVLSLLVAVKYSRNHTFGTKILIAAGLVNHIAIRHRLSSAFSAAGHGILFNYLLAAPEAIVAAD